MKGVVPTLCLHMRPNVNAIKFGGKYINLTLLADAGDFTHSHLSHIFNGQKNPSVAYARRIAEHLGMSLDGFFAALDDRKAALDAELRRRLE